MKTSEKVKAELIKINGQIEKLQQKKRVLEKQKKEMDNMQILSVVEKLGITPENLHLLNYLTEKELNSYLKEKQGIVPEESAIIEIQEEKKEKIS